MAGPLAIAKDRITTLVAEGVDEYLLAFSGGKDSLVCLDILAGMDLRTKGFFYHYLYPNEPLECEQRTLDIGIKRYGLEITYLPHPGLAELLRTSTLRYRDPSREMTVPKVTPNDIERVARKRTGFDWIVYGMRRTDSLQRCGMINKCGGIWRTTTKGEPVRRVYPIAEFKPADVVSYLRSRKLPIPDMFGSKISDTSGVSPTSPECVRFLKEHWPKDYNRLLKLFPFMDHLLIRDELRSRYGCKPQLTKIRYANRKQAEGETADS
jgi:3'-phosphoadenosine 5'-phosphosulfate sulfotransferase (PAPS reductase)/FAD synthetase